MQRKVRTLRSLARLNRRLMYKLSMLEKVVPSNDAKVDEVVKNLKDEAQKIHHRIKFLSTKPLRPVAR